MKIRKYERLALDMDAARDEYSSSLSERTHLFVGLYPVLSFIRFQDLKSEDFSGEAVASLPAFRFNR